MSEFIESKPPAQDQDSPGSKSGPIQNPLPTFVESKPVQDSKGPTKSGQSHGNPTPSFAESKPIHDPEDSKSGQNPTPTFAGPKQIQDSQVLKSGKSFKIRRQYVFIEFSSYLILFVGSKLFMNIF